MIDGGVSAVARVAELLHDALARCAAAVVPTVSIGVATGRIEDGGVRGVVRELIERADTAMYRAKSAGGNRTVTADDAVAAGD